MVVRIAQELERKEKGPWIISGEALARLDKTLAAEAAAFAERVEAEIQDELGVLPNPNDERAVANRHHREELLRNRAQAYMPVSNVTVTFRGGRQVHSDTMAALMRTPDLQDLAPISLELQLRTRSAKCSLALERDSFGLSSFAKLSAAPDSSEAARGAYAAFDTWLDECRQPCIVRQVERFAFAVVGLTVGGGLGSLFIWAASVDRHGETRRDALELLGKGVKPGDEPRALELLLRLQVGYDPITIPGWFWVSIASMVAVGL